MIRTKGVSCGSTLTITSGGSTRRTTERHTTQTAATEGGKATAAATESHAHHTHAHAHCEWIVQHRWEAVRIAVILIVIVIVDMRRLLLLLLLL